MLDPVGVSVQTVPMTTTVHTPYSRCRFGIATADITPPVGMYHRMWGAAKQDVSTGVHRPLRATAVVFRPLEVLDGTDAAQIVLALDHCILSKDIVDQIKQTVTARGGISAETLFIVCSHTHAAGLLSRDRGDMPGGNLISGYLDQLAETSSEIVAEAVANLRDATITYGTGRCALARHRDFWDEQSEQFVCGFNPTIPADDTVLVARITNDSAEMVASLVNYACHPTTLAWDNTLVSPDFPGATRELVEQAMGAPCLFIQGASGELGPQVGFVGDTEIADANGRQLGYAALAAFEAMPPPLTKFQYSGAVTSGATIGTWAHRACNEEERNHAADWKVRRLTIPLEYRSDLPTVHEAQAELERLAHAEEGAAASGDDAQAREHRARAERRRRQLARLNALPKGDAFPYSAIILRMGDGVWVGVQGEPYSLLQTSLRERFPGIAIIVASLGDSWNIGYLPTEETYGRGIYQESVAIVEKGSLELVVATLADEVANVLSH